MVGIPRRAALGVFGLGAFAVGAAELLTWPEAKTLERRNVSNRSGGSIARGPDPIGPENARHGSDAWLIGSRGTRPANDIELQIKGYASATSVHAGDSIDFYVSVPSVTGFTIDIYRFGWYGGMGARQVASSPRLSGAPQPPPDIDPTTGMVTCQWSKSWTLNIPAHWVSGSYLAVFTSASGWRSYTPFVVRDARPADLLVVLPFTTYQAYNRFPRDGRSGKSLYLGYPPATTPMVHPVPDSGVYGERATHVSFDRPYHDTGLPHQARLDQAFIWWAEQHGFDMTYATSLDLHSGRLDLSKYQGIVFSGHDEYWSQPMRDHVTAARDAGTSLAFMTANNMYWHVRLEPAASGGESRVIACYKTAPDPGSDTSGPTTQWRLVSPGQSDAEQRLLGVQYNGIVATPSPLVVRASDHWFWAGAGVREGERIAHLVDGEADGLDRRVSAPAGVVQTLLSASPYIYRTTGEPRTQNTSIYETSDGTVVFVAATFNWPLALGESSLQDRRIRAATGNLLHKIIDRPRAAPPPSGAQRR